VDEDLGRVLLPFGEAVPLPRRAYVEPGFFELDRALFRASWHPVASEGELASPGSYAVADVAGERVVVVRGADLELAAFLDGCVHRGVLLFPDERGRVEGLSVTCPYHGLRYDLRGGPEPGVGAPRPASRPGAALRPARVASRFGFVFVCVEPSVPELDAWWGETPPWLERASTHALRLGRRRVEHAVAANWKLSSRTSRSRTISRTSTPASSITPRSAPRASRSGRPRGWVARWSSRTAPRP
jgi:phenylpropionate dioxygenase-like ring-hydroxylating dioxygenase large terminal subunit